MSAETQTLTKTRIKTPSMWQVVLHNDDYTPMDFVVHLLKTVFKKTDSEAIQLMLNVHEKGRGIAGLYTKDIAITKVDRATKMAIQAGHPLLVTAVEA